MHPRIKARSYEHKRREAGCFSAVRSSCYKRPLVFIYAKPDFQGQDDFTLQVSGTRCFGSLGYRISRSLSILLSTNSSSNVLPPQRYPWCRKSIFSKITASTILADRARTGGRCEVSITVRRHTRLPSRTRHRTLSRPRVAQRRALLCALLLCRSRARRRLPSPVRR